MQFQSGANVFTAAGKNVGSIDRVVIDPKSGQVTHLVVRKGVLLVDDKVIPVQAVEITEAGRVVLKSEIENLDAMPDFKEEHYVLLNRDDPADLNFSETVAPPVLWYPPVGATTINVPLHPVPGAYTDQPDQQARKVTERNIPDSAIALEEGADVVAADGETVGSIERVITDPETNQVEHFLISQGTLFKGHKLVPTTWVDLLEEDKVRLAVDSHVLERLPDYKD